MSSIWKCDKDHKKAQYRLMKTTFLNASRIEGKQCYLCHYNKQYKTDGVLIYIHVLKENWEFKKKTTKICVSVIICVHVTGM